MNLDVATERICGRIYRRYYILCSDHTRSKPVKTFLFIGGQSNGRYSFVPEVSGVGFRDTSKTSKNDWRTVIFQFGWQLNRYGCRFSSLFFPLTSKRNRIKPVTTKTIVGVYSSRDTSRAYQTLEKCAICFLFRVFFINLIASLYAYDEIILRTTVVIGQRWLRRFTTAKGRKTKSGSFSSFFFFNIFLPISPLNQNRKLKL